MPTWDSTPGRAIVARPPVAGNYSWHLEDVQLQHIKSDELRIRLVATGICHTDIVFGSLPKEVYPHPRILGHEGAGYVEEIGCDVSNTKVGDKVLLSFASCLSCRDCLDGHPSYCKKFVSLNYGGETGAFRDKDGTEIAGSFFGQSSFSSHTVVKESSVVNVSELVRSDDELKLFAPLGCGFQTGVGTVTELTAANKTDTIAILGLGGVGLTAIMAAKAQGCTIIVGVDRFTERLDIAKRLGATHVINASEQNIEEEILKVTQDNGTTITIDTTGNINVIEYGLKATASRGQMILLGIPPMDANLHVHLASFMQLWTGKLIRGGIEGDSTPSRKIPEMIQWYRDGKLPIDQLIKFYPVKDFQLAISDMKSGLTVKPILVW